MEKKVTQESFSSCVPGNIALWLLSVWEHPEKSDEPISCKLHRGNSNLSITAEKNTLIPSQCWSLPVSALSISYPPSL